MRIDLDDFWMTIVLPTMLHLHPRRRQIIFYQYSILVFPLKNRRTCKRSRKLKDLKITISCRCISWSGLLRGCGVSLRLPAPIVAFFLRSTGGGGGLLVVEDAREGLDEAPPVVDSDDSCEISAIETAEGNTLHASCQLTR